MISMRSKINNKKDENRMVQGEKDEYNIRRMSTG